MNFILIIIVFTLIFISICILVINKRKENWDFLTHSTITLNKRRLEKLVYEDQALLPDPENKIRWIDVVQSYVNDSNFPQEIKDEVNGWNVNTPLVEVILKNPDLKIIFTSNLRKELFDYDLAFPAVYTQYIFNDMNYRGKEWYYSDDIIFLFNTNLLKDLPFMVCKGVVYGRCMYQENEDGFYGVGNYQEKPSLDKVQNMINEEINQNKESNMKKIEDLLIELKKFESEPEPDEIILEEIKNEIDGYQSDYDLFKFSNEILLDEIPFSYTDAIITTDEDKKRWIQEIVNPLGIPVYYIPKEDIDFYKLK